MTGEMSVKHEMRLFPVRLLPALSLSLSCWKNNGK